MCRVFDLLASPNIEDEIDKDPYLLVGLDSRLIYIETLINSEETPSILGKAGLKVLHQLHTMVLKNNYYYPNGKGFSKTQQWRAFIDLVNAMNNLFKDAVKKYESFAYFSDYNIP